MKICKHYDQERGGCKGYHAQDRPGGWVEKMPGECVFDGRPPQEEKKDKWCLGYEPDEKGEIMVMIDVFKFQIGDVVQFVSAPHHKMLIIEQHLQICTGGQQKKYLVRAFQREKAFGGISKEYTFFNEMELMLEPAKEEKDAKSDNKEG